MKLEVSTSIFIVLLLALVAALVFRPVKTTPAPKRYPFPTPPKGKMRSREEMNKELFDITVEGMGHVKQ